MNITVYLGVLEGNDPALGDAVRELGTWIGESGNSLIYGGSKSSLMGQIAESVLNAGGKVTGVEPQFFIDSELQYNEITELIFTKDMALLLRNNFHDREQLHLLTQALISIPFPCKNSVISSSTASSPSQ